MKQKAGKLRYDLIPPLLLQELARVFTFGADKYDDDDWIQAVEDDPRAYKDATMRHWESYRMGESHDSESHIHHLSHGMTNMGILLYNELKEE
jgi:hypothetical protein